MKQIAPEIVTEDNLRVIFDDAALDDLMLAGELAHAVSQHAQAVESGNPLAEMEAARVLMELLGRLQKPPRSIILQNRDRSTPAMIAQMNQIAAGPDYFRVAPTKEFASGTPIVFGNDDIRPSGLALGRKDKAVAADGRRFPVQYAVVEAADILTSNKADGTAIEGYASGVHGKLRAIAGNGRLAGLIAGFERDTAGEYVRELMEDDSHGVAPEQIAKFRRPVLVRIMLQDDVTENIGDISNQKGTSDLSPVEQAQNDALRLDLTTLDIAEDGSPTEAAALAFIAAMPESERNSLMDGKQASQKAYDRLMASVFWKAYGNPELVRLYAQSVDPEVKTILGGMASAAADLAKLDGAGELDIRSVITDAASLAVNAKRQGVKLAAFARQEDMTLSPEVMDVVRLFADNIRSAKKIGERLRAAARFAHDEFTKDDTDMFGTVEKASRAQVLAQLDTPADENQGSMFDAIDPMLELELSGKLVEKTAALQTAGEDDPLAVLDISNEIMEIVRQLTEEDAPEMTQEEKNKLAEKRDMLQDFLQSRPDSPNVDSWRAEIERINGIIGAPIEKEKQANRARHMTANPGDPEYMQSIYDLRYEWDTRDVLATDAKKIGAFKTRLRALAKKVPMSDEKAVFYIDALTNGIFGNDYDPKVAGIEFAAATEEKSPAAEAPAPDLPPQPNEGMWKNLRADILSSMGAIAGIDQGTMPGFDRSLFVSSIAGKIRRANDRGDTALAGTALAFVAITQKTFKKPVFAPANKLWKDVDWQPYAAQFEPKPVEVEAPAVEAPQNGRKEFVDAMTAIKPFMSNAQFQAIKSAATGEEKQFFYDKMVETAEVVKTMHKTYQQDGKGLNAIVHLHYFKGSSDWYITEKDREGKGTEQAFGYTILNNDRQNAEMGYISIEELVARGVELDLYWEKKTLAQVKARKSDDDDEEGEPTGPDTNTETGMAILKDAAETFGGSLSGFTQSGTNWQYADLVINGTTLRVGVSTGGVVSVNGDPFTPDRVMNTTLEAVLISIKAAFPRPVDKTVEQQVSESLARVIADPIENMAWTMNKDAIIGLSNEDYMAIIAKLEDENYHSEVLVMRAARHGTDAQLKEAYDIHEQRSIEGRMTPELSARRDALEAALSGMSVPAAENPAAEVPELAPESEASPTNESSMETLIKIAADDITKLRRIDVYRVLEAAGNARESLATYIIQNRPDLQREVLDVMAEEWPDLGYSAPAAPAVAAPESAAAPAVVETAENVESITLPLPGSVTVPPVEQSAEPDNSAQRAADLALLQDIAAERADMWADDLADRMEAIIGTYPGDAEIDAAWKEAVNAYSNFMVKAMSQA